VKKPQALSNWCVWGNLVTFFLAEMGDKTQTDAVTPTMQVRPSWSLRELHKLLSSLRRFLAMFT
jgi:hypothetical protein